MCSVLFAVRLLVCDVLVVGVRWLLSNASCLVRVFCVLFGVCCLLRVICCVLFGLWFVLVIVVWSVVCGSLVCWLW